MTIKEFIEKAIEGGWFPVGKGFNTSYSWHAEDDYHTWVFDFDVDDVERARMDRAEILLDPKAWQAVGKVEGWEVYVDKFGSLNAGEESKRDILSKMQRSWHYKMHQMIDALAEGKSLEESIKTL